jgi:hypothetical protein
MINFTTFERKIATQQITELLNETIASVLNTCYKEDKTDADEQRLKYLKVRLDTLNEVAHILDIDYTEVLR